jgi:autotransporter-associated beta strand protein
MGSAKAENRLQREGSEDMAAISWKTPVSGNWNVAADWSTGAVPTSADDVLISAAGSYTVTISTNPLIVPPLGGLLAASPIINIPDEANSLAFNAPQAELQENSGSLTIEGALVVSAGSVSLNEANTIGSVTLTGGGALAFGNGGALGNGAVTESAGELLATANETLTNGLSFSGNSTIAAAHGTTLTENASSMNIAPASTLNFGALGADGTILWHTPQGTNFGSPLPAINVEAGTLKGADSSFGIFLDDSSVTVAAGATLDLAGNSTDFTELSGGGAVIDSGAAATLSLEVANFSGAILGPLSLVSNGAVVLSGANTYTGSTTIHSGDKLQLGIGGATGSIGGGAISDSGALSIDRDNAITLTNSISGGGNLEQVGTGVTSIGAANTYTGGATISAGTLAIGNAGALGTGTVSLSGGRTAHNRERNPDERSLVVWKLHHRRRAWDDAQRERIVSERRGELNAEFRRAGSGRNNPLAYPREQYLRLASARHQCSGRHAQGRR